MYQHHFESDLVYNMDHMRISGIEPSSVILSQQIPWCPKRFSVDLFFILTWTQKKTLIRYIYNVSNEDPF